MSKEINKEKTNSLLNCPFCGGEARLHKTVFLKYEVEVVCENCGARTLTHSSASSSNANMNAIKAWNTRKPMQNIVERLKEELHLSYKEKERCVCLYPLQFDEAKGYARGIANAIEIVKEEGGIDGKNL